MTDFRGAPWVFDGTLTVYQMDEGTPNICVVADDDHSEANAFLIAAAPKLYHNLEMAAKQFRKYEALHRAKDTDDGRKKANSNMMFAQLCEWALAEARGEKAEAQARTSQAGPE